MSTAAHLELPDPTGAIRSKQPSARVESAREGPRARRVREAVEAVGNAALGIARRVEAIDQAQAALVDLRDDLQEAMSALNGVVKDLTSPRPRKPATARSGSTGGGILRVAGEPPREGTIARAIWDRLPATAAQIAADLGMEMPRVRQNAEAMRTAGRITSGVTDEGVVFRHLDNTEPGGGDE